MYRQYRILNVRLLKIVLQVGCHQHSEIDFEWLDFVINTDK